MIPEPELAVQERFTLCIPDPERLTVCGLPVPLSVTVMDAVSELQVDGVKATAIVQFAPAATELPQVFATSAKSAAFVPVIVRLLMFSAVLPPLVRVTV